MDYASLKTFKILTPNKSYVFYSILFLQSCYIKNSRKSSVKRFVQVSGNRSGRILSLQLGGGGGHLTPKKSLGRGAFHQRKGPHGEFDQKNKKMSNAQGSARGGGGGGGMGTLGFDSYIN